MTKTKIKTLIYKSFALIGAITPVMTFSASCSYITFNERKLNERHYEENRNKNNSVFETIIRAKNGNEESYKTFTSTYLNNNNGKLYFITSRSDLKDLNQKEVDISLSTLIDLLARPAFFFYATTKFDVVLSTDDYLVFSLYSFSLSNDWDNRTIKAPGHGNNPIFEQLNQRNELLDSLSSMGAANIEKKHAISYTPIQSTSILHDQRLFIDFIKHNSIVNFGSEEISKSSNNITYKNISYINNQFLGSPLYYDKKIVGILSSYKNYESDKKPTHTVNFYIFNDQDIKNIKKATNN